jgi:hypothetical protein
MTTRRHFPKSAYAAWPALAALLLAGCGAASKPTHPAPTEEEATLAYAHAISADWIDSPPPEPPEGPTAVAPGDTPGEAGRKVGSTMAYASDMETRAMAPGLIESLRKVTVGDCEWTAVDAAKVKAYSAHRVEAEATDGYLCAYEVFHDTKARGLVSAKGSGYFYRHEESWDFAQIDQANFEPAAS